MHQANHQSKGTEKHQGRFSCLHSQTGKRSCLKQYQSWPTPTILFSSQVLPSLHFFPDCCVRRPSSPLPSAQLCHDGFHCQRCATAHTGNAAKEGPVFPPRVPAWRVPNTSTALEPDMKGQRGHSEGTARRPLLCRHHHTTQPRAPRRGAGRLAGGRGIRQGRREERWERHGSALRGGQGGIPRPGPAQPSPFSSRPAAGTFPPGIAPGAAPRPRSRGGGAPGGGAEGTPGPRPPFAALAPPEPRLLIGRSVGDAAGQGGVPGQRGRGARAGLPEGRGSRSRRGGAVPELIHSMWSLSGNQQGFPGGKRRCWHRVPPAQAAELLRGPRRSWKCRERGAATNWAVCSLPRAGAELAALIF